MSTSKYLTKPYLRYASDEVCCVLGDNSLDAALARQGILQPTTQSPLAISTSGFPSKASFARLMTEEGTLALFN